MGTSRGPVGKSGRNRQAKVLMPITGGRGSEAGNVRGGRGFWGRGLPHTWTSAHKLKCEKEGREEGEDLARVSHGWWYLAVEVVLEEILKGGEVHGICMRTPVLAHARRPIYI